MKIIAEYHIKSAKFVLTVPFGMNEHVRGIPNRRFNPTKKVWTAPLIRVNVNFFASLGNNTLWTFSKEARLAIDTAIEEYKNGPPLSKGFPDWYKFKTEPRIKQMDALNFSYGKKAVALFMDLRTGKSKVIIDTIAAMYMENVNQAALIVCPLSIRNNWVREFETHSPVPVNIHILDASKGKKFDEWDRNSAKLDGPKVLMVGMESLAAGRAMKYCEQFVSHNSVVMIIDESSKIKNHAAIRTKNCISLAKQCDHRYILTGTPIANSIVDLYAQFQFLDPDIIGIGDNYTFRQRYCLLGGYENRQIIGYQNINELMELIKPHVYSVTQTEVFDSLPVKNFMVREVTLSGEQKRLYTQMRDSKMVATDDLELRVKNCLEKALRLQEITGGFVSYANEDTNVKDKFNRIRIEGNNPKLEELMSCVDETIGSIIIWAQYRDEIKLIVSELAAKYGAEQVVELHGGVSEEDRAVGIAAFQSKTARFLVGNTATGGMGLTLTAADTMIYYSISFNYIDRFQSLERMFHDSKKDLFIVDIVAVDTIDISIMEALQAKESMAEYVRRSIAINDEPPF